MAATNDVTGDSLVSKVGDKEAQEKFQNNFDAIFGVKPKKEKYVPPEYPETGWGNSEERIENIGKNGNDGIGYEAEN